MSVGDNETDVDLLTQDQAFKRGGAIEEPMDTLQPTRIASSLLALCIDLLRAKVINLPSRLLLAESLGLAQATLRVAFTASRRRGSGRHVAGRGAKTELDCACVSPSASEGSALSHCRSGYTIKADKDEREKCTYLFP